MQDRRAPTLDGVLRATARIVEGDVDAAVGLSDTVTRRDRRAAACCRSIAYGPWRAMLAASVVLCLAGCLAPVGEPARSTAAVTFANDQPAFDYFLGKGLTHIQAAGIVGNLDQESNMNPGAVQPGGPGRGIAQWSVGGRWNASPGDNAVAYAASLGKSVSTLGLQLDFIWFELTTFSGYGLGALKKATTTSAATLAFMTDFEACGTCLSSQRISYAQAALAAYGSDHVDAGADAAKSLDAGKSDGSASGEGKHGDAGPPGAPGAENADPGTTSPTQETNAATASADEAAADQGGCSIARATSTGSLTGVPSGTWLASLCAAAAMVLRRRRRRVTWT